VLSGPTHWIASISYIKAPPLWKCRLWYCCGLDYPIITWLIKLSHPIGWSDISHWRCYKAWLKRTLLESSIAILRCDLGRWSVHAIKDPYGIAISQLQKVKALPLGFPRCDMMMRYDRNRWSAMPYAACKSSCATRRSDHWWSLIGGVLRCRHCLPAPIAIHRCDLDRWSARSNDCHEFGLLSLQLWFFHGFGVFFASR